MSDTNPIRREPSLSPAADAPPVPPAPIPVTPVATATTPRPATTPAPVRSADGGDQLSRIEDKAARIEEKFARIESLMQRVETAASHLSDVARQSDVRTLSERVRALPGFSGLVATAVITAVLTAILFIAIIRFVPGLVR